jgi:hypothetical protein
MKISLNAGVPTLSGRELALTVTLNLKPEVESGLAVRAQAWGMTMEEYLLYLSLKVESAVFPAIHKASSAEERVAAFEAWPASHRPTPVLSDYARSRDEIYEGRDH